MNFSPTGTVTSKFGDIDAIRNYKKHTGIDFSCKSGESIHSLTDGIVSKITNEATSTLGNGLFIKTNEGYTVIYGHASKLNVGLSDVIHKGDVIALCGSSGHSTGSHLHFAIQDSSGHYINPQAALDAIKSIFGSTTDKATEAFYYFNGNEDKVADLFQAFFSVLTAV